MNIDSSFAKSPREVIQNSKNCKAFKDISKYFSRKEWGKLRYSEKITYVYMKRNYKTMTNLGLRATLPAFMRSDRQATESQRKDSDEDRNHGNQGEPPQKASRVQQRKRLKMMPKKPAREGNGSKGVPGTPGSEQTQRQLCTPGKASTFGQQNEKTSEPKKWGKHVWTHRLRERRNLVVYEEISDPEEDD
ncbi:putative protein SSX6 [Carlito syrichta]|uniref:Uncharacterized protein n=1 Tax=Carlito syrichta TaxID=1868482 RepID=A0A1U7T0D1_CARSF|nr:putative protein SSX6 [Carlito syrichta]